MHSSDNLFAYLSSVPVQDSTLLLVEYINQTVFVVVGKRCTYLWLFPVHIACGKSWGLHFYPKPLNTKLLAVIILHLTTYWLMTHKTKNQHESTVCLFCLKCYRILLGKWFKLLERCLVTWSIELLNVWTPIVICKCIYMHTSSINMYVHVVLCVYS